jgi:uncharacterized protein (DUF1697 family)
VTVYVSLFRGINLGGKRKVKMDALRALHASLGLDGAQSLLQSGNVVFAGEETDAAALAERIARGFEKTFGFSSDVILRTLAEIRSTLERNPFAGRPEINPSRLLVTFLAGDPDASGLERLAPYARSSEEIRLSGRELYLHCPDGIADTKLTMPAIEKHLGTTGTARNLNTVNRLRDLAAALHAGAAQGIQRKKSD